MILTVAQTYPTQKNLYNNGFVHSRVKSYIAQGIQSEVFVITRSNREEYEIEGVKVKVGNAQCLAEIVNNNKSINCVCFHFLNPQMLNAIRHFNRKIGVVVFVHGNEALWWYERIFPERFSGIIRTLKFFKYVYVNTTSILRIQHELKNLNQELHIVGVSDWMLDVAKKNWKLRDDKVYSHVIPNVVNENVFQYSEKDPESRFHILLIRQFTSGKYALDIAMDTIRELEQSDVADKLHFTIYGDGWLFDKYTSRVKEYKNVEIHRKFLTHDEIAKVHAENGIFLCPTRQDAQGVSMCEAMSSGLVPISSNNTAIPEYLPIAYNLMFNDAHSASERILELVDNPEEFQMLSRKVSEYIREKCCADETTKKEIDLIKRFQENI